MPSTFLEWELREHNGSIGNDHVAIYFSVLHDGQPVSSNHCGSEDCFSFFLFPFFKINSQKLPSNENRIYVILFIFLGGDQKQNQKFL